MLKELYSLSTLNQCVEFFFDNVEKVTAVAEPRKTSVTTNIAFLLFKLIYLFL